jgi:hypothetical protein
MTKAGIRVGVSIGISLVISHHNVILCVKNVHRFLIIAYKYIKKITCST